MKILVEIRNRKAVFALEVFRSFAFVKKAEPISGKKVGLMQEIKEGVEQVQLDK